MRILLYLGAVATAAIVSTGAFAQSETDRLREALRSAIAQTRALEDQRTALQAQLAEANRDKTAMKAEADAARAEVRKIEDEHREAVDEFNQRLADRDQTLDKWKTAYEEAANVARAKDAERAKFEGEANTYKASTKSCVAKNDMLVKAGRDLVERYRSVTMDTGIAAYERMFQMRRVELQNELQDAHDRFLDQKVKP
jgi:chromosome segregation ATPase